MLVRGVFWEGGPRSTSEVGRTVGGRGTRGRDKLTQPHHRTWTPRLRRPQGRGEREVAATRVGGGGGVSESGSRLELEEMNLVEAIRVVTYNPSHCLLRSVT